jgi:predicted ArsR family transcriptional regulator
MPSPPQHPPAAGDDFDANVEGIAALGEPLRRRLYRYVVSQAQPVGRDEAAEALGVPRHVARFHLDRLEEDGLLEVEFRRPPGRSGPGAGRPSKYYRRASREVAVSLPGRRYDLAGRIMARALTESETAEFSPAEALTLAAVEAGTAIGREVRTRAAAQQPDDVLDTVEEVIEEYGYEPRESGARIILANCPFHSLAREYTDLVCGMNLDLFRGILDGAEMEGVEARLEPAADRCCVVLARP